MGASLSFGAKFAKSAKGRVLVQGEELTATGAPAHSYGQQRCSLPIWHFFDVRVLADCLPNRSSRIWPPNVRELTLKGRVCRKMDATIELKNTHFDNKFDQMDVLLNRVTFYGSFASVTK